MSDDNVEKPDVTPEDMELAMSYEGIAEALRKETDRSAGILAASFLENHLEQTIRRAMVEGVNVDQLFKSYAPLSTFSGKIDVAHAFGITSPKTHRALGFVRKIRNHFAHHPKVTSFDVSPVRDWSMELVPPTWDGETAPNGLDLTKPRERYLYTMARIMIVLWLNSKLTRRAQPPRL
jgi:hypothetical protein